MDTLNKNRAARLKGEPLSLSKNLWLPWLKSGKSLRQKIEPAAGGVQPALLVAPSGGSARSSVGGLGAVERLTARSFSHVHPTYLPIV